MTKWGTLEILTKIDEISEIDGEKVAVIGSYQTVAAKISASPNTVGIMQDFLRGAAPFITYSRYYYARNFSACDDETVERIKTLEEFKNMGCYPKGEYVKRIDGIIVVKLSES